MNLKIKNYELETFAYILYEMKLGGKKSRMRTRLFKVLQNYMNDLNEANEALVSEYALHDESGQLVYADNEKKSIQLDMQTKDDYYREYETLCNEEVVLEINEATVDMMLTVAQLFLNEEVELNQNEALIYDNICEQLEQILALHDLNEASG
ncbi:DUF1617 family protein [Bacillus sp. FJAT-22090]|uniref:DUF1617 family protein n=1 Tax=Bacillus sp. FJAT-22090 TaxID=1581038 RepID=UPI001642EC02|nr:DUF1617 family protein [Bacillus sp. FJAT-22090]